uniref:TSA: Wollemia nobilis Ref_Wollemi_Transcript_21860_2209 transcribed RNA sequence n=1 Tax=Wollemia nobilis TaxID=56998 RepID=A0A0C9QMP3_9CONI
MAQTLKAPCVPVAPLLTSSESFTGQKIFPSRISCKVSQKPRHAIRASVSERISQADAPVKVVKEIPGSYGPPLLGVIRDRQDFFNGREDFFRSRMEKYESTVYRVNMPPGGPFFPDPRVIMLLDAKSFRVLFDTKRVEKRDLFTGTYMPSTDYTGGYRTLSYLDPSEEKHGQLKNFCFEVLKMNRDRWIPEFDRATSELWQELETQLAEHGRAAFNEASEQMCLNFLCRSVMDRDPAEPGETALGSDGPSLIKKWIFFQLAPINTIGLPRGLEELTIHTFPLPFGLVKKDYDRVHRFFAGHATRALDAAEKMGLSRDEACHNLIFNICFNTWGGMLILFPSIVRLVGRAGARLHSDLAQEVRAAVRNEGGGRLTMRALESMPLVKSTVYEVMRLEPPVPFQYGRSKEDFQLESHDEVYNVKKGELLGGYQPFATRDPRVFEAPEEFVPRRFMGEQGQQLLQYVLWSNGPETESPTAHNKQCAGKDFVVMMASLLLAEFFLQYDSFDMELSAGALGSAVSFTSLKKATS